MLELIINNMCFAMLCCLLIFMVENVVDNSVESKPSIVVDSFVELKLSKVKTSIDAESVKLMFILKLHLLIMVCLISVTMKLT